MEEIYTIRKTDIKALAKFYNANIPCNRTTPVDLSRESLRAFLSGRRLIDAVESYESIEEELEEEDENAESNEGDDKSNKESSEGSEEHSKVSVNVQAHQKPRRKQVGKVDYDSL